MKTNFWYQINNFLFICKRNWGQINDFGRGAGEGEGGEKIKIYKNSLQFLQL